MNYEKKYMVRWDNKDRQKMIESKFPYSSLLNGDRNMYLDKYLYDRYNLHFISGIEYILEMIENRIIWYLLLKDVNIDKYYEIFSNDKDEHIGFMNNIQQDILSKSNKKLTLKEYLYLLFPILQLIADSDEFIEEIIAGVKDYNYINNKFNICE